MNERSLLFLLVAILAIVITATIIISAKKTGVGAFSPNPVTGEFELDRESRPYMLVVTNSGNETVKELKLMIFDGKEEKWFNFSVEIPPHSVRIIRLGEKINEEELKKAKMMEVYNRIGLVARIITGGESGSNG